LLQAIKRARTIHLTYCYRIPREAGLVATKLIGTTRQPGENEDPLVKQLRELSASMNFGFSASFIEVNSYNDIPTGIAMASHQLSTLLSKGLKDIGIIFCGNAKDRQLYGKYLAALGYDCSKDRGVLTPRSTKGQEFDYTLLISPELLVDSTKNRQDFAIQVIYVALAICRRGLSIYTTTEFAGLLRHPAVELKH